MKIKNIAKCPRCGKSHKLIKLNPFKKPMVYKMYHITYWSKCPKTKDPIMWYQKARKLVWEWVIPLEDKMAAAFFTIEQRALEKGNASQ